VGVVVAKKVTVAKKMSKEELREDKVITGIKRLGEFSQRNIRYIAGGAALVLLVIVGVALWNQSRARSAEAASLGLSQAQQLYFTGGYAEALARFQAIESQHGSGGAMRSLNLFIGNCHLSLGNPGEAESAFRSALGDAGGDPILRAGAQRGLAAALADQGKTPEAASEYQKAAEISDNPLAADDWWAAGNAYAEAGNQDSAKQAYQKIVDEFPSAPNLMDAKLRLAEINARQG
jgi:tetratricopeptide (TPR) repeat protein